MSLVVVDRVAVSLPCSPKTAPLNLHDATVQALLSSMPQLTSIQPNHHTFRTYASSTPGSQETETNFIRHPICIDRSILLNPNQRRFTHKRNKSAPIWLHNPPPLSPTMEIERRNSLDEIHQTHLPDLWLDRTDFTDYLSQATDPLTDLTDSLRPAFGSLLDLSASDHSTDIENVASDCVLLPDTTSEKATDIDWHKESKPFETEELTNHMLNVLSTSSNSEKVTMSDKSTRLCVVQMESDIIVTNTNRKITFHANVANKGGNVTNKGSDVTNKGSTLTHKLSNNVVSEMRDKAADILAEYSRKKRLVKENPSLFEDLISPTQALALVTIHISHPDPFYIPIYAETSKFDYPCLPLKFPSSASTDEGVGLGYESGSVSTPSTDERIDNKSIDSCINSYDIDEAYNTDSSQDFSGYPGLVNSSTWIGVQQEQGDDNMVEVKVGSKSSHVVHFSVKAGDVITWEFATTKRDIGFGILFECAVVEEADPGEHPEEPSDVDSITSGYGVIPILPIFKVKSNISPIFGSHEAVTDGVYVMTWDNSYSRFFAKELYYRISTQTEIRSSEFPYSVVSVQHSYATMSCPALEEVEESYSNYSSASHSARTSVSENNEIESHNTLCETPPSPCSSHRPSPCSTDSVYRIQQNVGQEGQTVYFDVAANTEQNKIEDI